MEWLAIGVLIGFFSDSAVALSYKKDRLLSKLDEDAMLAEVKRRVTMRRIAQEVDAGVDKEVRGPRPPTPAPINPKQ